MPRKTADQWFADYGAGHQRRASAVIQWICVPVMFACALGLLFSIPTPESWDTKISWFDWSLPAIVFAYLFYLRLSFTLSVGMLAFMAACHVILVEVEVRSQTPIAQICAGLFVVAWIVQFIGHRIEGQKLSFLQHALFLLLGPAWLLSKLCRKIRLKY